MKIISIAIALILCLSIISTAEEHPLSNIKGTNIELKVYDHAIAGSIKDFVVFGNVDESTFTSTLFIKKDGQVITAEFKKQDMIFGGTIKHRFNNKDYETNLRFIRINKEEKLFFIKVNDQEVAIKVTYDAFENNHFINPTYTTILNNGEIISFKLENGKACYGYSAHLVLMILGAYLH